MNKRLCGIILEVLSDPTYIVNMKKHRSTYLVNVWYHTQVPVKPWSQVPNRSYGSYNALTDTETINVYCSRLLSFAYNHELRLIIIHAYFILDHPRSYSPYALLHCLNCIFLRTSRVSIEWKIQLSIVCVCVRLW